MAGRGLCRAEVSGTSPRFRVLWWSGGSGLGFTNWVLISSSCGNAEWERSCWFAQDQDQSWGPTAGIVQVLHAGEPRGAWPGSAAGFSPEERFPGALAGWGPSPCGPGMVLCQRAANSVDSVNSVVFWVPPGYRTEPTAGQQHFPPLLLQSQHVLAG